MARKKKIPSIDYSIKLIVERITSDLGAEIDKLSSSLDVIGKRLSALEKKVDRLKQEEHWAVVRSELGIGNGARRRVSKDHAKKVILMRLKKAEGEFVSSRELGGPLGIGRATVATRIKELKKEGYKIGSSPRKGYMLDD